MSCFEQGLVFIGGGKLRKFAWEVKSIGKKWGKKGVVCTKYA